MMVRAVYTGWDWPELDVCTVVAVFSRAESLEENAVFTNVFGKVELTEQEIREIHDDQDRIAAIVELELSIEIELAEMSWLSRADLRGFLCGLRR
ncbi:hypothetical protein [Pseudomonas syringae]|uniref:hypothetical protein n=1 Tax=Pseudomonas syringae TaxID=317 RepID=UPI002465A93A|nr:hypothetical protein [Pseudomonas syringae]MDH4602377.1 hypothetical protein [Pseudomonas syringae pv. papulans]